MIPPVEERQVRPCDCCVFLNEIDTMTITGDVGMTCKLLRFLRRDGLTIRCKDPCPSHFTREEIIEIIESGVIQ